MVVEHTVRSEGASQVPATFRRRVFSGKIPHPGNEVDYDTWRNSVDVVLHDLSFQIYIAPGRFWIAFCQRPRT